MDTEVAGNSKNIYLVFSITTTRIGKMIRRITRYPYSHVSVSLTGDLAQVYSFARHYRDTPFYGGFVRETRLRYHDRNGKAKIMVCAVPVSSEQHVRAAEYIDCIAKNNQKYLYNVISAAFAPVHMRIFIDRAYTCVEFGVELLNHCGIAEAPDPRRFCSIERLIEIYGKYALYEGPFPDYDAFADDYDHKNAMLRRVGTTLSSNARLLGRLCRRIIN